jgi:outer membrane protein G
MSTLLLGCASFAHANEIDDHWKIRSNTYMEVEKFEGHRDADDNKVTDKVTGVGQLFISNPNSAWRYFLEHKASMRNYDAGSSLQGSDNSFIRNRTQIGVTRNLYKEIGNVFDLNVTYRKESNDGAAGKDARPSNVLFWVMPSGTYWLNEQFAVSFWDAFYHYDNFRADNSYEWEAEHGIVYKINDRSSARLFLYTDWTFDKDFNKTWEQNQIRGYFPTTINDKWNIMPYFRYFLSERNYDSNNLNYVNQRTTSGLRVGSEVNYNLTPKLTLWTGFAAEQTRWEKEKGAGLTSGSKNEQIFYLGQLGVKYQW